MLPLAKRDILSATWFSLPGRQALSRPSYWLMRRLQKSLLRLLPVRDDADIFLVQESAVALSTRMSDLEWGGYVVLCSLITSRTVSREDVIVACSMMLIVIRSSDFILRSFGKWPFFAVLELEFRAVHSIPCETWVSWNCDISVYWDCMTDWDFPSKGCRWCCHDGEEVYISPHGIGNIELFLWVPHYFVGFW